jgi:hypothetical protein
MNVVNLLNTIAPKSDQLNADDLIGRTLTIKVTKVAISGTPEQPIAISYEGDGGKPYMPCKSMRRVLVQLWGGDGNAYVGRRMSLYRDDKVQFGGAAVGGIRISHMSDIEAPVTMALTATRANRKPFTVKPLAREAAPEEAAPSKSKITPEQWANAQIKILNALDNADGFTDWLAANGKAMAKLKASDESTWATLNEIVSEVRAKLVGDFE